ncbi:MAG: DUF5320 family protein [Bacteroidetes bacterium]|nr:DUF5320 family protein [Bacteroidota bacterium]
MPQLDKTGPIEKSEKTGRGLGYCQEKADNKAIEKLGKGMGLRRKSGGGEGLGKRLKAD